MSGTRSHFRRGPVTEAVIVSHGQPSKPKAGEYQIETLAKQVGELLPTWSIRSATLAAPGALEKVLEVTAGDPLVYPVFMAEGWFTKKALPDRLGDSRCRQLSPLGTHPELPRSAARLLHRAAERRNWHIEDCDVLIAAHGSPSGQSAAKSCKMFAAALRDILPVREIRTGFLEQEPSLFAAATRSGPKTLALPFFATAGGHVTEDIPMVLNEAGFQGVRLPCIGQASFIPDLIAHSLKSAAIRSMAA